MLAITFRHYLNAYMHPKLGYDVFAALFIRFRGAGLDVCEFLFPRRESLLPRRNPSRQVYRSDTIHHNPYAAVLLVREQGADRFAVLRRRVMH